MEIKEIDLKTTLSCSPSIRRRLGVGLGGGRRVGLEESWVWGWERG